MCLLFTSSMGQTLQFQIHEWIYSLFIQVVKHWCPLKKLNSKCQGIKGTESLFTEAGWEKIKYFNLHHFHTQHDYNTNIDLAEQYEIEVLQDLAFYKICETGFLKWRMYHSVASLHESSISDQTAVHLFMQHEFLKMSTLPTSIKKGKIQQWTPV